MNRWWYRHGSQVVGTVAILGVAWFLKQIQVAPFLEAYYLATAPLQSERQLLLEDKLTNARILELEQKNDELQQQNSQFKKLLDYVDSEQQSSIPAPIIGRHRDGWWNQLILGRGSKDGIQEGYIVTGIGGVVGRVVDVTKNTSRVLLISNPGSRVGAIVSQSRHLGYLQGNNDQTATMYFFARISDVKPGDAIATSPLSHLYPPGMPIGKITSISYNEGPAPKAEVKLSAPLELLEWVVIQPFKPQTLPSSTASN